jgi:hypothetical protein
VSSSPRQEGHRVEPTQPSSGLPLGTIALGLIVVGLGAMAWTYLGPDLRRYIKMSSM